MNINQFYQIPCFSTGFSWPTQVQNPYQINNDHFSNMVFCYVPICPQQSIQSFQRASPSNLNPDRLSTKNSQMIAKDQSENQNYFFLKGKQLKQNIKNQNMEESDYDDSLSESYLVNEKKENNIMKKYKQNAERNIMTNIGNQMITFVGSRKRSQSIYLRVNKEATKEEITTFYEFVHKLRKRKRSPVYINREKLFQFWYPKNQKLLNGKHYQILRRMSLIFIQEFLPLLIVSSTRIKKQTKMFHISAVRKFLHLLRYQKCV